MKSQQWDLGKISLCDSFDRSHYSSVHISPTTVKLATFNLAACFNLSILVYNTMYNLPTYIFLDTSCYLF